MIPVLAETRAAVRLVVRMIARRPWLVALFAVAQILSNLLRLWIGAADNGSLFVVAVGGIFLLARIFLTQWLHVAAARLADDQGVGVRDAFSLAPRQAVWFHLMVLVATLTFWQRRFWVDGIAGDYFAPVGIEGVSTLIALSFGLLVTYLIFLPLVPGYFAALLGPWRPRLPWSMAGVRGQLLMSLCAILLLAVPIVVARRFVFDVIGKDDALLVLATASADAALTVLLMLVTTAIYWRTYRRALERIGPPPARAGDRPA